MNTSDMVWEHREMEALLILQEECGELTQAISKCFRFGKDSEWNEQSNLQRLESEIGDVLAMIDILIEHGYVSDSNVNGARINKKEKLKKWSSIYESGRTSENT